jgi:hypothetical protein
MGHTPVETRTLVNDLKNAVELQSIKGRNLFPVSTRRERAGKANRESNTFTSQRYNILLTNLRSLSHHLIFKFLQLGKG